VFTPWDTVTDAFNAYYGGTHFLVPAPAIRMATPAIWRKR
jgi:hypothetical protein